MKIKYSPGGPDRRSAPKQWETWLADAPFGPGGKTVRGPVAVGKRNGAGWTVYAIIPSGERGGKDALITDLFKAGQDRPCAVHNAPAVVQNTAFIQKMGDLCEEDIRRVISGLRRSGTALSFVRLFSGPNVNP